MNRDKFQITCAKIFLTLYVRLNAIILYRYFSHIKPHTMEVFHVNNQGKPQITEVYTQIISHTRLIKRYFDIDGDAV